MGKPVLDRVRASAAADERRRQQFLTLLPKLQERFPGATFDYEFAASKHVITARLPGGSRLRSAHRQLSVAVNQLKPTR